MIWFHAQLLSGFTLQPLVITMGFISTPSRDQHYETLGCLYASCSITLCKCAGKSLGPSKEIVLGVGMSCVGRGVCFVLPHKSQQLLLRVQAYYWVRAFFMVFAICNPMP